MSSTPKPSATKTAEHGGFGRQDTNVAILIANPGLTPSTIKSPVETTQIAPTMVEALGADPQRLKAVQMEQTVDLPGLAIDALALVHVRPYRQRATPLTVCTSPERHPTNLCSSATLRHPLDKCQRRVSLPEHLVRWWDYKERSMPLQPTIITTDLEGVLVPEIWIAVAERTGIEALRLTTRDLPDYDQLMQGRLRILQDNNLGLSDIQAVIATLQPLRGARQFFDWLRTQVPCTIVSHTFMKELRSSAIPQFGYPTLLCHQLEIDAHDRVVGYRLRQPDSKRRVVEAFQGLGFRVIAIGDSYNDTAMLTTADTGILFRAPEAVSLGSPQLPVVHDYAALRAEIAPHLQ